MLSFFPLSTKGSGGKSIHVHIFFSSKLTMVMFSISFHVSLKKDRGMLFSLDHDLSFCLWSFIQETILEG